MRKQWNSKQRFSLRKFSTGLASVLLATMFMSQGVMAQTNEGSEKTNDTEMVNPNKENKETKENTVTNVQPKAPAGVANGKVEETANVREEAEGSTLTSTDINIGETLIKRGENTVSNIEESNKKEDTTDNKLVSGNVIELKDDKKLPKEESENKISKEEIDTKKLNDLISAIEKENKNNLPTTFKNEIAEEINNAKLVLKDAKTQAEINKEITVLEGLKTRIEEANKPKRRGRRAEPELQDVNIGLVKNRNISNDIIRVAPGGMNYVGAVLQVKAESLSDNITDVTVDGAHGFMGYRVAGKNTRSVTVSFEGDTPGSGNFAITVTVKTVKGSKSFTFGHYTTLPKPTIETSNEDLKGKADQKPTVRIKANTTPPNSYVGGAKLRAYLIRNGADSYSYGGQAYGAYPEGYTILASKDVDASGNAEITESDYIVSKIGEGKIKAITVIELPNKVNDTNVGERGSFISAERTVTAPIVAPVVDKNGALEEINTEETTQKGNITSNAGLTSEEKQTLTNAVTAAANTARANINKSTTDTDDKVTGEKNAGIAAIRGAATKAKTNKAAAIEAIDAEVTKQNDVIEGNNGLTSEEKTSLKQAVSDAATAAKAEINKATTNTDALVEKAKTEGITAIQFVIVKEMAKHSLNEAARREKAEINSDVDPDLTDAIRKNKLVKVDETLKAELAKLEALTTNEAVKESTKEGIKNIEDIHKPQSSKAVKPAVLTLPELDLQTALVAGTATVKQGQELTDDDITNQLILPGNAKVLSVIKPSTDKAGNFVATVELLLSNEEGGKTKVTVNVPVSIYSQTPPKVDDLSKAKEEAIAKVEKAVKDKLQEIAKQPDLTEAERNAAKTKVDEAKESAWKTIAQASSLGTAEFLGDEYAKNIAAFTPEHGKGMPEVKAPDVAGLDEAKAKGIAAVLQAEVDKLELMKKDTVLTPSEKEEVKAEVARIRNKAIADIRREKEVTSVNTITNDAVKAILNARPTRNYSYPSGTSTNRPQSDNDMMKALLAKKEEAKMLIEQEAMKKKAEISQAELSESEKALLDARVDQEKAKAFQMIDQVTTIEEVDQALKAGIEAIRSIAVASANGRMTDVTSEESEEAMAQAHRQALPQTGTGNEVAIFGAAASAILAGLGLVVPSKKKED